MNPHSLGGLQIFHDNQEIDLSSAAAEVIRDTVVLRNLSVKPGDLVKLGCTGWYHINLYNMADLPALPASTVCR